MANNMKSGECCPKFNPEPWQDKIIEWDKKRFVKGKVSTVFYMPVNFGKVIRKVYEKIDDAKAENSDWLCLSDHTSKWNMDIYLAVDKEVPGVENTTLSGKYLSRVYEGSYSETKKWCEDYDSYVKSKGMNIKKWYMWYTTCPKCTKKYGKNYIVIMGEVN